MDMKDATCSLKVENVSDEEDAGLEEVPDDFFDDFSNKEFLAGLDVVDAWDGTCETKEDLCDDNVEKECVSTNKIDGNVSNIKIKQEIGEAKATQILETKEVEETKKTPEHNDLEKVRKEDTKDFKELVIPKLEVPKKTENDLQQEQVTSVVTAEVKPSDTGSTKETETSMDPGQVDDTMTKNGNDEKKQSLSLKPIDSLIDKPCTNKKDSSKPKSIIKAKSSGNGSKESSNPSVNSSKSVSSEDSAHKKVVDNKNKCAKTIETSTVNKDSKVKQNVEEKHGVKRQRSASKDSLKTDDKKKQHSRRDVKPKEKDAVKQLETRRDPKKRDRDIERDKLKCAKDKEAKLISEKLRVVETGLVPPGTEMECDVFTTKKIEKSVSKRARSPPGYKPLLSLSPSPKRSCDRRYDRRYSPDRKLDNLRKTSPLKRSRPFRPSRSISPVRKYSPRRSPFRSRYSRPSPQRRRSWSRDSPNRDRVRDSPPRKRTFLEELDEKLAQKRLQEIQQKINDRRAAAAAAAAVSAPLPVPAPVPAPMSVTSPMPVAPPMIPPMQQMVQPLMPYNIQMPMYNHPSSVLYDQQYFIGHPTYSQPTPGPNLYNQYNAQPNDPFQHNRHYNDEAEKLFNDDKIKLTDFLCITSRANDEIPANISNKIKVIAQSQDAIKIATEYSTPSGRFIFKNTVNKLADKQEVLSNWSPLRKTPVTRLSFITKKNERPLKTQMSMLLSKLGFTSNSSPIEDMDVDVLEPPPKDSIFTKTTQTEPETCEKCEERKQVKFVDVGIQCDSSVSVDFGCQVREDDFLNTARYALQNIIKNQSLASLTPAQILASLSEKAETLKETVPAARKSNDSTTEQPSTETTRRDYDRRRPREHSTDRKESRRSIPDEDTRMEERWSRHNYDTSRNERRSSSLDWKLEESWYADDPPPMMEERWSREDCYERRYGGDFSRSFRRESEIWDDMSRGSGSSSRYPPPLMQRGSRFNNTHFNGPSDNSFADDVTPGQFFNARRY